MKFLKKLFRIQNLIVFFLIIIIGHNVFLQFRLEKIKNIATASASYSEATYINLGSEGGISSEIIDALDEIRKIANDAKDAAEIAAYESEDAAENSFGNYCNWCPQ